MPISIETLEKDGVEVSLEPRESRSPQVLAFLKDNADNAYTQADIAAAITESSGKELQGPHAHSILMGLVKKGVVERKQAPGKNAKGANADLIYYRYVGEEA